MTNKLGRLPAWVLVSGLTLLGAVVRFAGISKSSIWHDEGFTLMLAPMSLGQIIARTARDVHPPLYYILLHYWIHLFGTSEVAVRSLSALAGITMIPLTFLVVRRLWDARAALFATLFMALGPFAIRYSQEARMHGLLALLALLATYALLRALQSNSWRWWAAYSLALAAGLYTHYYAIFIVITHALYVLAISRRGRRSGVWNPRWWIANLAAAALFVPWLPALYSQLTRVNTDYWIVSAAPYTIPNTLLQFLTFTTYDIWVGTLVKAGLGLLWLAAIAWLFLRRPRHRSSTLLLALYGLLGPVLILIVSISHPLYIDRYFTYCTVAFYALLGIMVAELPRRKGRIALTIVLIFQIAGIYNVHTQSNHQMRMIGAYVNNHYRAGDAIIAGEPYVYFDFSYYNRTGHQMQILSQPGLYGYKPLDGYGESSVFYERLGELTVPNLSQVQPRSGKVWLVGKTEARDYYTSRVIPANWHPVGSKIEAGYVAVQEYEVLQ